MKVVVTGVNGFVGQHLVRELVSNGNTVVGVGIGPPNPNTSHLLLDYLSVDLRERWPSIGCDSIVHLAALSAVGPSFRDPQKYIEANSAPMTNLGEALLTKVNRVRVIVVSTGAVYRGTSKTGLHENSPLLPTSPYVVSKLVTEAQSAYYRQRGLDVVVMRPFNHVGPGQSSGFLLPDLVNGVKTWMRSGAALTVGNLDTRRDYTDVRDVVRAYRLAVEAPRVEAPVLNICSGTSVSGRELLGAVAEILVPGQSPEIRIDESRLRPEDPKDVRGDGSAIGEHLGWRPTIPLDQSVRDVLEVDASGSQGTL